MKRRVILSGATGEFSPHQRFEIKKKFPYEWVGGGGMVLPLAP